ncbi:PIG-L deacetylase family protein [Mycobacterium vicinigordonae]|uniref:PIG-L deacetylase family protein n=1 Tax=Mycobacterium vicinigordonae TaxID=1719132 RepID=UPI001FE4801B|nr:PIG-L family deacetylase [Mycobacterium vicinigordonae]
MAEGGTAVQDWLTADRPPPLDLDECAALVVVSPHPDDETLGIGATAAQLAAAGVPVQLVAVSDGGGVHPEASAAERLALEAQRRAELRSAAELLEVSAPLLLGLPDGQLTDQEDRLAALLTRYLDGRPPGTWCAATWRGDGHPDHEAVGRAAAIACTRTGIELVEYPVWMWHWAVPEDPDVPWDRARTIPLRDWAVQRKSQAAQCFHSQLEPAGPDAVLPPFVLERLMAVGEVVFR